MSTTGTTTDSGTSKAEAAKGAASEVAGEATSAATDVKETVKTEVRSVVSEAADRAGSVMRTSQDELRTQASDKAKQLSSTIDSAAQQLASMADAADDPSSTVAQLTRSAADQLRQQSRRLEEGGLEGLVEDARRFARNRPGAFMLGTVAAGFIAGRLAKHADLKQAMTTAKEELAPSSEGSQASGQSSGFSEPSSLGTATTPPVTTPPPTGTVLVEPDPTGPATGASGGAL